MKQDGTLGSAIRKARKSYPLTLEELGEEIGVTHAFLSRVENNKVIPNEELLSKIANVLDYNDSQDYLNEFRILAGNYKNIEENTSFFNDLKSSGRLEINKFSNEKEIVDKPYYKLNYLFESENKVFYDIKTSIFGEKIATVELPHDVLQQLYKTINIEIIKIIKTNPSLLNSIGDPEVIEKYQNERAEKRIEFIENMKYLNVTDSIEDFMREIYDDENLT
ncbi:helix-turn-helix protein [Staphylococcus arlettae]|uniref:helix-turn-helix domain-containing protein n=1 Tax=Staphylococcus arlettae TaxID=29378 RepID=UPI00190D7296|nr:helix-turn-helix transcriptional regulator [Staphylococcus arlettae]MBK3719487.1 helix-turn-helix protein [Staphylococcus arlettae]